MVIFEFFLRCFFQKNKNCRILRRKGKKLTAGNWKLRAGFCSNKGPPDICFSVVWSGDFL